MSKILMITGASSDFGTGFIERNHESYDKIIAHYNTNKEKLLKLNEKCSGKLILKCADLNDIDSVKKMMNEISASNISPHHFLHFAAKKLTYKRFRQIDTTELEEEFRCSVFSFIEIMKSILPNMSANKYGKAVVMLSSCLSGRPPKFMSSYVMSKYALLGSVMSLSAEYAEKGICINAVSPDMTDTNFISDIPEMIVEMTRKKNVMKRNLSVDEVLPTIEYLLSDASDKVTGQNIFISGVR